MAYWATDYFEQKFLNTMKNTTFTAPSNVYIGLYTSNPTETGSHTSEVNYTGYARQKIIFKEPSRPSGETEICAKNSAKIQFPRLQANAASVTITHIGISDNATRGAGNMLVYGQLEQSLTAVGDEAPVFLPDEVVYYVKGDLSDVYKKKLLNILRGTSITGFTSYAALFNGKPESGGVEVGSGSNYTRKSITFSAITKNGDKSHIQNSTAIDFDYSKTNWGITNYRAIYDAATGGNPVWYKLGSTKSLIAGRQISYEIGDLRVEID